MKKVISRVALSLIALYMSSCGKPEKLEPQEYLSYVEEDGNGFKKEVSTNEFEYVFQYKPINYIVYKEMGSRNFHKDSFNARVNQLSKTVWFNIHVSSKKSGVNPLKGNSTDLTDYNKKLSYYLSQAGNDIGLYYGGEEMQQVAYYFENNHGLTPDDIIVVGYSIPDSIAQKDIVIEYEDRVYDNGIVKAKISSENLLSLPKIIL